MQFKGTKGKWRLESNNSGLIKRVHVNDYGFAEVYFNTNSQSEEEYEANALLISKAPELLEKLNELTQIVNGYIQEQANNNCFPNDIIQKVLKAEQLIKEATDF